MLRPIQNKELYEEALAQAYSLMQLNLLPESNESDELETLSMLIKKYEQEHYPFTRLKANYSSEM